MLRTEFPTWQPTEQERAEVVNTVVEKCAHSELAAIQVAYHMCFRNELASMVTDLPDQYACPICMEPLVKSLPNGGVDTSNIWFAPNRKTEHWNKQACRHLCCRSCMSKWAETAINDQMLTIKCPAVGCSYCLWDQDLKVLVSQEAFARHQDHKNRDYLKHLRLTIQKDDALTTWLKSNARPCPDCHVIVSHSEGCDQMMCICGARFCYKCGYKKCQCRSHRNREDIWHPRQ